MSSTPDWIDGRLADRMDLLRPVPQRDPQVAAAGRAQFLALATSMTGGTANALPTQRPARKNWAALFLSRWELSPVSLALTGLLLVFILAFAGIIPAAQAARASLPGEPLYWLKLLIEDARLELVSNADERMALNLVFSDLRIGEIEALNRQNRVIPDSVTNRLEMNLDAAFQSAADLSPDKLLPALERLRYRLEAQQQTLIHIGPGSQGGDMRLLQAREVIAVRLAWIAAGLQDMEIFRSQRHIQGGWSQPPKDQGGAVGPAGAIPTARVTPTPEQPVVNTPTRQGGTSDNKPGSVYSTTSPGPQLTPASAGTPTRATESTERSNSTQTPGGQSPGPSTNPTAQGTQSGPGPRSTPAPPGGGKKP